MYVCLRRTWEFPKNPNYFCIKFVLKNDAFCRVLPTEWNTPWQSYTEVQS